MFLILFFRTNVVYNVKFFFGFYVKQFLIIFINLSKVQYERHLPQSKHLVGKQNTQAIERKHLTLHTRIKRLARKTICFSKLDKLHDIVIGLFINRHEFGRVI
ncbi:IS1 family transposase [Candidiatus Paracoxiella cheracis]|uniref:IS1 family transposase n=1 Tax=Candidiatus Paracoxiella cheracis TaxID=3405120 RepID=UPI003BF5C23B